MDDSIERDDLAETVAVIAKGPSRENAPNDFELGPTLGQGGMGVVRLAKQRALSREVALKSIQPKLQSPEATNMLLQEALILARLDHPNILPIHAIDYEAGSPRLVLKKIEGVEWSKVMHDPGLLREELGADDALAFNLEILMSVCNAIDFAHSRGIVHRDLKPDNVMIGEFGEVYVMDWGLAVCLEDDGTGRLPLARDATQLAGTPQYMAPEMLGDDQRPITERTDVYLLGAILYEIVAGHAPHNGRTMQETICLVARSRPELPEGCPSELGRICQMAMDPDPGWRIESAGAFRGALAAFQKHADSRRLTKHALEQTSLLLASLLGAHTRADHERLEGVFAECRFAYRQALESWPENDEAKEGLSRASAAMVEHELAQGNPQSAATLLSMMAVAPEGLRERAEQCLREASEQKERVVELERLRLQLDMQTGARNRAIGAGLFGLVGAFAPAFALYQDYLPALGRLPAVISPAVMVIAFRLWARGVRHSSVTRRALRACSVAMAGQLAVEGASYAMGLDASRTEVLWLAIWFTVGAMLANTVDRRLYPMTAGFLIALLTASLRPEWRYYALGASSLIMAANTFFLWMPGVRKLGQAPQRSSKIS